MLLKEKLIYAQVRTHVARLEALQPAQLLPETRKQNRVQCRHGMTFLSCQSVERK